MATIDAVSPLLNDTEMAAAKKAFTVSAERMMFTCPPTNLSVPNCFNVADLASRYVSCVIHRALARKKILTIAVWVTDYVYIYMCVRVCVCVLW